MKPALTISTVLALFALSLSNIAQAGPTITDKDFWVNEVHPSSPAESEGPRARAQEQEISPTQSTSEANSGLECRYEGGPKSPMTCQPAVVDEQAR
jgi:hypothetical protein